MDDLKNKKVAFLVDHGFEEIELTNPRNRLEENGAQTFIVSTENVQVKSWENRNWGQSFTVDVKIEDADGRDFDALVLPGGVINSDRLRRNSMAVNFVKHFLKEGKPVAAICHGPVMLIESGLLQNRIVTSHNAIKTDLINAGAHWENEKVIVDHNLITSRNVFDIEYFTDSIVEKLSHLEPVE